MINIDFKIRHSGEIQGAFFIGNNFMQGKSSIHIFKQMLKSFLALQ